MLAGFCACLSLSGCGGAGRAAPAHTGKGVYHHVKPGQTLWSIARTYNVDLKTLVRANRLSDRDVLRVGQRLLIPGARRQRRVVSHCPCPDKSTTSVVRTAKKRTSRATSKRPAVSPPSTKPIKLSWPILGTVTQRFSRSGPQRHDGIDIAAPRGSIIRAAADGKVIFSDWGPGGYGRLVIVEHTANIVTVYAHNERNLVQHNQRVKQGQAIATVGRSGRATSYHVHFELRFETVPKPPFPFLPQQHPAIIHSTQKFHSTQGTT
jgi:murein DD-endopeptidase MepM/ murein hydrolase activator NlpD